MPGFRIAIGHRVCGVYLLYRKGRVVYVGQSTNLFNRIAMHINNRNRMKMGKAPYRNNGGVDICRFYFDEVQVELLPEGELDSREIELIQKHQPAHNVLMNRPAQPVDITKAIFSLPGFADAMKTAEKEQTLGRQLARKLGKRQATDADVIEDVLLKEDLRSLGV